MNAKERSAGARVVDVWPVGWPLPLTAIAPVSEWDEAMAEHWALVKGESRDAVSGATGTRRAALQR